MAEAIFYILSILAIAGGVGVVTSQNVVHAAVGLILSLLAVAGFYILLTSEFLALVQVLVYGAVATIILFGLMLTRSRDLMPVTSGESQRPLGLVAGALLLAVILGAVLNTEWPRYTHEVTLVDVRRIGDALFERWLLPFEIASVVLLVALIGAIVISRQEEGEA
jgi:NADH-quinone oxidoreductase subunit J